MEVAISLKEAENVEEVSWQLDIVGFDDSSKRISLDAGGPGTVAIAAAGTGARMELRKHQNRLKRGCWLRNCSKDGLLRMC